jgi:hypothetical protein
VLVNGSFNDSIPEWMQQGSPEFNAIAQTYGRDPIQFFWSQNSLGDVSWPQYSGIHDGAFDLAAAINALPPSEVNIIAHSHGGNVAIEASWGVNRLIKHLIELGTPVNWEVERHSGWVGWRCTASSWDDIVQFEGASSIQVANFWIAWYEYGFYLNKASDDFYVGDYEQMAIDLAIATGFYGDSQWWWSTTKEEWQGSTIGFSGLEHSSMHEPYVWSQIPGYCKTGQ